jgi:NADPH:quinone reductase-like Zn-dependent oxidoreductase
MNRATFRAAVVRIPAGPDSIEIIDVPVVEPGPGEIRIQVAAAPVNPVDLGVADGFFHRLGLIDQPDLPAWDGTSPAPSSPPGPLWTCPSVPGSPAW